MILGISIPQMYKVNPWFEHTTDILEKRCLEIQYASHSMQMWYKIQKKGFKSLNTVFSGTDSIFTFQGLD